MEVKLLKSAILSNTVPNLLVMVDTEAALCRDYIKKIASTRGVKVAYLTAAEAINSLSGSCSRWDDLPVVWHDKAAETVDFLQEVERYRNPCIVVTDKDSNPEFLKAAGERLVIFDSMDENTLVSYATRVLKNAGISIRQELLFELVRACECDYGKLANELDKVITLGQTNASHVTEYLLHGGFSDFRKQSLGDFIQQVMSLDKGCLVNLYKIEEQPYTVLLTMYNAARGCLTRSGNMVYARMMKECMKMCFGIVDGTQNAAYAVKAVLVNVFGGVKC